MNRHHCNTKAFRRR